MMSVVVDAHNPSYSKNYKTGGSCPRNTWAKTRPYIKNNPNKKRLVEWLKLQSTRLSSAES
jgi:hypothetical protein